MVPILTTVVAVLCFLFWVQSTEIRDLRAAIKDQGKRFATHWTAIDKAAKEVTRHNEVLMVHAAELAEHSESIQLNAANIHDADRWIVGVAKAMTQAKRTVEHG